MKKIFSKIVAFTLMAVLVAGVVGDSVAYAAELTDVETEEGIAAAVNGSGRFSVYTNQNTRIYTGIGRAQWLHITPWNALPTAVTITMKDYSGTIVYTDVLPAGTYDTTHWYIGANVKYVYLKGGPCVFSVTWSDH